MHVLEARATRRSWSSVTSHSTSPMMRPPLITLATATSLPSHTGRRKLIFSSRVVKLSPSATVAAYAQPIARSARSQSTPPWSVPNGLAWRSAASKATTARPGSIAISVMPSRVAMGGGGASPRRTRWIPSSGFGMGFIFPVPFSAPCSGRLLVVISSSVSRCPGASREMNMTSPVCFRWHRPGLLEAGRRRTDVEQAAYSNERLLLDGPLPPLQIRVPHATVEVDDILFYALEEFQILRAVVDGSRRIPACLRAKRDYVAKRVHRRVRREADPVSDRQWGQERENQVGARAHTIDAEGLTGILIAPWNL